MERDAINLTLIHEWMTVNDAKLLLHHQYMRVRSHKKYGGSLHKFELSNITNLGKKRAWSKSYPIVQWVVKK